MANKTLTVESMKKLGFRLQMHLNGGSKWSGIIKENEEYGLIYSHTTDGSPTYKYTKRTIATADGEIVLDLLSADYEGEYARFVEKYNERILKVVS